MRRLLEIRKFILKDYQSLTKSIKRPRTHQNIVTKKRLLTEHLEEFEEILTEYGETFSTEDYNKYTDIFHEIKTKVGLGIAILERTPVIPSKSKQNIRRKSDDLSDSIKEFKELQDFDLPLSSTLLYDDDINREEFNRSAYEKQVEQLKIESIKLNSAIEGELNKTQSLNNSTIFSLIKRALQKHKIKMANKNVLMKDAIQCIPEYNGSVDELEPFLVQIQTFSEQIPAGQNEKVLLNIVLTKLEGNASAFINRIKADTWVEMRQKLIDQFSKKVTEEEILQKIETLEQKNGESFRDYVNRAQTIKELIDAMQQKVEVNQNQVQNQDLAPAAAEEAQEGAEAPLNPQQNQIQPRNQHRQQVPSFAERCLKIHFMGGLRNSNLKQAAKNCRAHTFNELIQYLKEVYIECEQLEDIEHRLESCRLSTPQQHRNYSQRPHNSNNQGQNNQNYNNINYNNNFVKRGYQNHGQSRIYQNNNQNNRVFNRFPNQNGQNQYQNRDYNQNYNQNYNRNRNYNQNFNNNFNQNHNQNYNYNNNNYNQNYNQRQFNQNNNQNNNDNYSQNYNIRHFNNDSNQYQSNRSNNRFNDYDTPQNGHNNYNQRKN